jgi:hypothetical protein
MTSTGQPGQASENVNTPPQEARESPRHNRRLPTDRFPLPGHRRTWPGIMLSLIALAGVALVVACGSHQATPGGTSAPTGGAPTAPGSVKASQVNQAPTSSSQATAHFPPAAQVAESGGALSLPTDMQSSVLAWQSGPGGTDLAAVTSIFGHALQAAANRQYLPMRFACIQLARSVSTAEAGPQIPVAAMQTLYGTALAELAKGAADCQAAITVTPGDEELETIVNSTMRQQATSELAAGARDIFRSTAEIEIASRQSR